jgi:hypothetical protein
MDHFLTLCKPKLDGDTMSNPWFRFYHESLDDPKVQNLPPEVFKFWVNLLCLACRHDGKIPSLEDISFALRLSADACRALLERLLSATLIDSRCGGSSGTHYALHGWEKRQYKSDTSYDRVKRYRERIKNAPETPPDTDTEQRKKKPSKKESPPPVRRGGRLPSDWMPKEHQEWKLELAKFRDYWAAQPGERGVKLDWDATWRNWIRRAQEKFPTPVDRSSRMGQSASRNFV